MDLQEQINTLTDVVNKQNDKIEKQNNKIDKLEGFTNILIARINNLENSKGRDWQWKN